MHSFTQYSKDKIFITLTILLMLSLFILIRTCDYPLLIDIPLLRHLFVYKYNEKLPYNISISYIVTYVFYIIQIYIPTTLKNKAAINILRPSINKEVNYLKYALCILDASTDMRGEYMYINQTPKTPLYINISKENAHYLRRFSYGETLSKLKMSTIEIKNTICNNHCLQDLDPYISTLLTNLAIENLFSILEQVDKNRSINRNYKFTGKSDIADIQSQIYKLESIFNLSHSCTYSISHDVNLHSKYDHELSTYQQDEYMYTIDIN